jgi:hypothetical protein
MTKLPFYPTPKNGITVTEKQVADEESLVPTLESLDRPLVFISAIFVGLAVGLIVVLLLGFGTSEVWLYFKSHALPCVWNTCLQES